MKKIFSLVLFSILLFLTGCQSGDNSYTYFIGYDNYEDFIEVKVSEFSDVVRVKMEANPNLKLDDVTLKVDLNLQSPFFGSTVKERIELKASDTRQVMFDYEKTLYQYINFDIVSIHGLVSTNDDIDPELTIKQAPLKEIYKKVKDYQNSDTFYAKSSMKIDDIEEEVE